MFPELRSNRECINPSICSQHAAGGRLGRLGAKPIGFCGDDLYTRFISVLEGIVVSKDNVSNVMDEIKNSKERRERDFKQILNILNYI